jgi:hypothetical protein
LKKKNIGVYLDFDNIWGGLLRELRIDIEDRRKKGISLLPAEVEALKEFLNKLSSFIYEGLTNFFSFRSNVRYVKAFAVFSKLPFITQIGEIQTLLHNSGIEPFTSFIAKDTKDASDRALILEVVEDVFFNQLPVNIIVIGSGDIDFYPLVSFFYEHSDKDLYILSFKNSLNYTYFEIPLTSSRIIDFCDLSIFVPGRLEITLEAVLVEINNELETKKRKKLEIFKDLFFKNLDDSLSQGKSVKTGLVIKRWKKEWKEKGYSFDDNEINYFLDLLQQEGLIKIEPFDERKPLYGKIVKVGG